MGFWGRLFGKGDRLPALRRSVENEQWAEAMMTVAEISRDDLDDDVRAELDQLEVRAGDGLAGLNLDECEACLRAEHRQKAAEHLELAIEHGRSEACRSRIKVLQKELGQGGAEEPSFLNATSSSLSSCSSCSGGIAEPAASNDGEDLDPMIRLELILAGYPEEVVERYQQSPSLFQEALLLAHEGQERQALKLFEQIPEGDRDEYFLFERGSAQARLGNVAAARRDLQVSVEKGIWIAVEALVSLEMQAKAFDRAETLLQSLLAQNRGEAFCHSRLMLLALRKGDEDKALEDGITAVNLGHNEPDIFALLGNLFEKKGRFDEAEAILQRLSKGGCAGGVNLPLAEFQLRQKRHLKKALETFKAAARHEGENPLWPLRMGQVYLELGWKNQAKPLLEAALRHGQLPASERQVGTALLKSL